MLLKHLVNKFMPTVPLGNHQTALNKPTTPSSPNGIAHSVSDITGTDGTRTNVKSERAKFKLDWAAWVADYRLNGFSAAYDGTFTSVDGSSSVNVDYADE